MKKLTKSQKRARSRKIFIYAAELMQSRALDIHHPVSCHSGSCFACDCLYMALSENAAMVGLGYSAMNTTPEYKRFVKLFKPETYEGLGWWPTLSSLDWDYESRILALYLCAEMYR